MKKIYVFISLYFLTYHIYAQRNVILIIADDLGTDYLGCYEDYVDTVDIPNIRGLLKKGVRFKNGMTNPVCSSTRSGILTGRYSFRTGVGGIVGGTGGSNQLDTSEQTIPRLLKKHNAQISTADIGKWHLHNPAPAKQLTYPNLMGYDHFEGPFIGQLPSYTNWTKYVNGTPVTVTNYATTENVNNALSWLKTINLQNPFFLWLAFNAPHAPYHLPPVGLHTYKQLSGTQQDINKNPKNYFKAMFQALDHEIGRLFDSLKVHNIYDSTDIIFIGDNGNTNQTAQIADLDKAKGTIYQYGVHTPFIISGPSVVNPNRVSDALVNTVDLFATIMDIFGHSNWATYIPSNKPTDTKSIMPILKDQSTQIRPWSFCEIFKLTTDSADGKAMRNIDYKLIKFDYGAEEFYDLKNDPNESKNLLKGLLNPTEVNNYFYLCNEMNTLIGKNNSCNTQVGIDPDIYISKLNNIYPNPFTTYIYSPTKNTEYILRNSIGEMIYTGKDISDIDFTFLPSGVYILHNLNTLTTYKLIKN